MKRIFWIFTVCVLSLTTAFGQDDNYYQNGSDANKGDNSYNNGSPSTPPPNYNANIEQSIPPNGYYEKNNGPDNTQSVYQAPDNANGNSSNNSSAGNNNSSVNSQPANPAPANESTNGYNNSYPDNGNNTYSNQPASTPAPDNAYTYNNNNVPAPANQSTNTDNGDDYANYQNFHDQLSPYGNWVNYPGYGNVWVPTSVPAGFSPYATAGHWVYTTYGWSWVSDYAWGGIPFHYGRWFRDNTYGWMWMPGYQWASAWVTWGSYNNFYCWAPIAPFYGFSAYYRPNPFFWNFCDRAHFCDFHLGLYRGFYGRGDYRGLAAHINVIGESRMYGGHAYFAGPRVGEVERAVGHSINAYSGNRAHQNMMAHNNNGARFHQQANANQYHGQNFSNHANVQSNHFANNNMQSQYHAQQFNRGNNYSAHYNGSAQYQRPNQSAQRQVQQHNQYSGASHMAQSYRAPERSYQRSQPVHQQSERSFASAQRSSSHGSTRSGGGGSHGGRR